MTVALSEIARERAEQIDRVCQRVRNTSAKGDHVLTLDLVVVQELLGRQDGAGSGAEKVNSPVGELTTRHPNQPQLRSDEVRRFDRRDTPVV